MFQLCGSITVDIFRTTVGIAAQAPDCGGFPRSLGKGWIAAFYTEAKRLKTESENNEGRKPPRRIR